MRTTPEKSYLGNLYKATPGSITGYAMLVVVCEARDTISCCELDCGMILGSCWSKANFNEEFELLEEGIWEGDKVLIIDRIYQLNGGTLELIK